MILVPEAPSVELLRCPSLKVGGLLSVPGGAPPLPVVVPGFWLVSSVVELVVPVPAPVVTVSIEALLLLLLLLPRTVSMVPLFSFL